jgi:hypothetical protein
MKWKGRRQRQCGRQKRECLPVKHSAGGGIVGLIILLINGGENVQMLTPL